MVDNVKVTYLAVANFLALKKAAAAARKDLEALEKQEAKTNKASVEGSKKVAAAHRDATKALRSRTTSTKTATNTLIKYNEALEENRRLQNLTGSAAQRAAAKMSTAAVVTKQAAKDTESHAKATEKSAAASKAADAAESALTKTNKAAGAGYRTMKERINDALLSQKKLTKEQRASLTPMNRVHSGLTKVSNSFRKLSSWRPRLIPPFVALIPLIAGVLALLNPLVATLSAVGAAGFGAGAGLLSLGGAAVAIVPMISAAVGAIAGLLVAFRGVGSVFSKYSSLKKSGGGGGGGGTSESPEEAALRLERAQNRLTDAQYDAIEAQDDLNEARREAVRRLEDLRKAVQRASTDEADAAANAQLALENYYNVLADPGSTAGEKQAALVELQQAQQDVIDTRDEAIRNAEDLAQAEKEGVEGTDEVVAANRRVRDALLEVREAQLDLNKARNGSGGGGGGGALSDYNEALEKLSPSARSVVLAIIGMSDAWDKMRRSIQEAFFSKVVDDMDELASLIPTIGGLLEKAAGAMGRFAHNFLQLVSSPEWDRDFEIIGDQNVRLIDLAGQAVLALSTAWKDLIIAAGPFAEDLLKSFAKLSENFSQIVSDARDSGSLAKWLDTVYGRLQQWWRIVKNIAQTLFNYGAASAEFGQWITDGLEKLTDGWKKSSEEARREGSPFKMWLEDIKPLLREVKGLFGDFFGWLRKTSMDENVISEAISILSTIRTELGPALAGLMEALTETGIGTSFVSALASIVDILHSLIDAGFAEGFKTFFDIVTGFFSFLADAAKDPVWGPFISTLGQLAAQLAALSFITKFTGLQWLFSSILALAGNAGVMKLLGGLGGLGGLAAGAGTGIVGGGVGAAAGGGAAAAAGGGAAAALGPAAIAVIAASIAEYMRAKASTEAAKQVREQASDPSRIKSEGVLANEINSAQAVGSTGQGVMVNPYSLEEFEDMDWDDFFGGAKEAAKSVDTVSESVTSLAEKYRDLSTALSEQKEKQQEETEYQRYLVDAMTEVNDAIAARKQAIIDTQIAADESFTAMNAAILENGQHWADGTIEAEKNKLAILEYRDAGVEAAEAIRRGGGSYDEYVAKLQETRTNLQKTYEGLGVNTTQAGKLAAEIVKIPTQKQFTMQTNADAARGQVQSIIDIMNRVPSFKNIYIAAQWKAVGGPQEVPLAVLRAAYGAIGGLVGQATQYLASGGVVGKAIQYLADGGGVRKLGRKGAMDPKGTDTVPAMLTPGEYVLQKDRVDEYGPDRIQDFNDGKMTLAELLAGAKGGGGPGYFNGGGLARTTSSSLSSSSSARAGLERATMVDNSVRYGDINLYYPKRERASESLPNALRKVAYVGGRRVSEDRLDSTPED